MEALYYVIIIKYHANYTKGNTIDEFGFFFFHLTRIIIIIRNCAQNNSPRFNGGRRRRSVWHNIYDIHYLTRVRTATTIKSSQVSYRRRAVHIINYNIIAESNNNLHRWIKKKNCIFAFTIILSRCVHLGIISDAT